ncbi:MAG: methionine gamma-lyase family protein [Bacilli bacterium]|nr:methionine gamma-lyase family protein [Bacilli bacterium]
MSNLDFNKNIIDLSIEAEKNCKEEFDKINQLCELNSIKVLKAFNNNRISEMHFNSTTGYGYNDIGRDTIEKVFAEVLGAEDALVRSQFISGSHALTVALFAFLRPNDIMLSITGKPYDTLDEVIGIRENASSLKSFGIEYEQIDLIEDDFDYEAIREKLKSQKIKLIEIQRSKGYSTRKSITIDKVEKVIQVIREIDKEVIIMIDNCYCEFVEEKSPCEVGADIIVGSLIKNLGGGIAPNGAYIAGKTNLVELAAERLTVPGEGREVGPTLGINKQILQGLYMAPSVVANSLKTAIFASYMLEKLGYKVEPKYNDARADIVQNIIFNDPDKLIAYTRGIQYASAIDSFVTADPSDMPGYEDQVIMASGSFTQGSSIELSCDGPLRSPYIAYQQGGLTYEYGKLGVMNAINNLIKNSSN